NDTRFVNPDLQFHHFTVGGRTDQAGSHANIGLVECANIARILIVIDHFIAVSHRMRHPSLNLRPTVPHRGRHLPETFPTAATYRATVPRGSSANLPRNPHRRPLYSAPG